MFAELAYVAYGGLCAALAVHAIRKRLRYARYITEAAAKLDLTPKGGWFVWLPSITGQMGKYQVSAESLMENKELYLEISLKFFLTFDTRFRITAENHLSRMKRTMGYGDMRIGDDAFDRAMRIEGAEPHILVAYLNAGARDCIMKLVDRCYGALVTGTEVAGRVCLADIKSSAEIVDCLELFHNTVSALDRGSSTKKMLMENIESEKIPGVVVSNIKALSGHCPVDGKFSEIMNRCLEHESPEVQAAAARYAGGKGLAHLVTMLGRMDMSSALTGEIIDLLRAAGHGKSAKALEALYAVNGDAALRAKIIDCLGSFGDRGESPFIVHALDDTDAGVRETAVKALALCGTVEAVEPLGRLAAGTINPFLKGEIRKTIEAIQTGIDKGKRGMLSIQGIADMDGALSRDDIPGEGALSKDDMERSRRQPGGKE